MNEVPAISLPEGADHYASSPVFTEETVPNALLEDHDTKAGVWGLIRLFSGRLHYHVTDVRRVPTSIILEADGPPGVVEPTVRHRVEPIDKVVFQVEFYRAPAFRSTYTVAVASALINR